MNPESYRMLIHFSYDHLPEHLLPISRLVAELAVIMAEKLDSDDPIVSAEVNTGLRKLLEAKDCFVRARLHIN